jgi:succinyl-CoA synthetase beta subunit
LNDGFFNISFVIMDFEQVPLVVRLAGTNVEKGKELLQKSGVNVITADDLDDAAKKAVAALKKGQK